MGPVEQASELRRIEAALGDSPQLNQHILENVPGGVVVVSPQGAILRANAEAARFLGLAYDELTARFVADFAGETWREDGSPCPVEEYPVSRCLATQAPQPPATIGVRQRDGTVRWAVFTALPVNDPAGDQFLGAVVTFLDITERRRIEERHRLLIENSPDHVFTVGPDGRILYINHVRETHRREDVVRRPSSDFAAPAYRERWEATLARLFAGEPCQLETVSWEGRHYLSRGVPLPDGSGRVQEVMFITTDVTEAKQAEQERQRLEARVREAQRLEGLGLLAGGMAHDFNNLLVGILGGVELALRRLPEGSPAWSILSTARQASLRASELTHQLLAYAGKGQLRLEPVDLDAVVREASRLAAPGLAGHVALELELTEPLPAVEADPGQLGRVVMNLITNAAEALPPTGGTVRLRTRLVSRAEAQALATASFQEPAAEQYALLEVQDDGCGMDEATRARIFDPFFTTKFQGRGLGLPAVLGVVRGHGGGLGIQSAPGVGTTFRVLLRSLGRPAPRPAEPGPTEAVPAEARATGPRACVLVVDDEVHVRTVARVALEEHGFQVLLACHGGEALELLRRRGEEVDLVLLDLVMPEVDGSEALRAMRALRPDLPVILSSGYGEETAQRGFDRAGLAGFLHKPYSVSALLAAVSRVTAPT